MHIVFCAASRQHVYGNCRALLTRMLLLDLVVSNGCRIKSNPTEMKSCLVTLNMS